MHSERSQNLPYQNRIPSYFSSQSVRFLINALNIFNEICLTIYLMVVPIQIAYHHLLSRAENRQIQDTLDVIVLVLFSMHLFLYFDVNLEKIYKKPYSRPKYSLDCFQTTQRHGFLSRILTVELLYDLLSWALALYMVVKDHESSFGERAVQLLFFLKIYKLYKFHKKTIFLIIGTPAYPPYKAFFTILVVFMAISYVSSVFYFIDYQLYLRGGEYSDLLWISNMSTEPGLIDQPFIVQLLLSNYWALGTASTAAYGDISGIAPDEVLFNIFALFFEGFLYGFYLNNIHSIPLQAKDKEMNIIQKFDQFQKFHRLTKKHQISQHPTDSRSREGELVDLQNEEQNLIVATSKKIGTSVVESLRGIFESDELYLKIICSLEYQLRQKESREGLEEVIPDKYLKEIKYCMYKQFLDRLAPSEIQLNLQNPQNPSKAIQAKQQSYLGSDAYLFVHSKQTLLDVAMLINECMCEVGENIYEYPQISQNDLIFVKEGELETAIRGHEQNFLNPAKDIHDKLSNQKDVQSIRKGDIFGLWGFVTGVTIPHLQALAKEYLGLFVLKRSEFLNQLKRNYFEEQEASTSSPNILSTEANDDDRLYLEIQKGHGSWMSRCLTFIDTFEVAKQHPNHRQSEQELKSIIWSVSSAKTEKFHHPLPEGSLQSLLFTDPIIQWNATQAEQKTCLDFTSPERKSKFTKKALVKKIDKFHSKPRKMEKQGMRVQVESQETHKRAEIRSTKIFNSNCNSQRKRPKYGNRGKPLMTETVSTQTERKLIADIESSSKIPIKRSAFEAPFETVLLTTEIIKKWDFK